MKVLIDPGHGGTDRGAKSSSLIEAPLTLKISKLLYDRLKGDSRFIPMLTRTDDQFVSLEERANIARTSADLLMSIHANSSPDPKIKGTEIYFQNQLSIDQESAYLANRENELSKSETPLDLAVPATLWKSKKLEPDVLGILEDLMQNYQLRASAILAEAIVESWSLNKPSRHRMIRQAPFFVVSNIKKPAVLIEVGYLTNPDDNRRLQKSETQNQIAKDLHQALVNFKELMDKSKATGLN